MHTYRILRTAIDGVEIAFLAVAVAAALGALVIGFGGVEIPIR